MILRKWGGLPVWLRTQEARPYYESLKKKRISLILKRIFDFAASGFLLGILSPLFLILAAAVKKDSPGPVFFRQVRATQYGRPFCIYKFRTMVAGAEKLGAKVTSKDDPRVTRVGAVMRKFRLDEIPQLINIISGDMTFVGTRPEVFKYVRRYTPEMAATLLLPAGVTSYASIAYKDEEKLLDGAGDVDEVYVNRILPKKMKYNLRSLKNFSLLSDISVMLRTIAAVAVRR